MLASVLLSSGDMFSCVGCGITIWFSLKPRFSSAMMASMFFVLTMICQAHMGVCINAPQNIIFMHKRIKEAFDRQEWCLLVQADGTMQVT